MKRTSFNEDEIAVFKPSEKIGLVATVNPDGLVHVTLITSIMASSPTQLTLGQFCLGRSKWFMQQNPKLGFLIMTLDRKLWRGKARWTHKRVDGPEFEEYNDQPMFRYNAYFGVNTVHYLDLVEVGDRQDLPIAKIAAAALLTKLAKGGAATGHEERILKPFAEDLFNKLDSLTFLVYLGGDGYPVVVPVIQCQASDSRRLTFSPQAFGEELQALEKGAQVAVFCANLKMQSVLVRGTFAGFDRYRFLKAGTVDIEWVYNSMPPNHDQIYPAVELKPVVEF
ncbi:MAG: hypothetical protein GY866_09470 [Proteobacteria bacterium]|nr:hypothetical protein [Pseudomonadota bacterium]